MFGSRFPFAASHPYKTSGSEVWSPGASASSWTGSPHEGAAATAGRGKDFCILAGRRWKRLCMGSVDVLNEEFHLWYPLEVLVRI